MTSATPGSWAAAAVTPLSILFSLNLLLFAFNLLPLPPLDGSAILPGVMSDDMARGFHNLLRQPMFSMIGLLAAWRIFPLVSDPLQTLALNIEGVTNRRAPWPSPTSATVWPDPPRVGSARARMRPYAGLGMAGMARPVPRLSAA